MGKKPAKAAPIFHSNGATSNEILGKSGNGSTPQVPAAARSSHGAARNGHDAAGTINGTEPARDGLYGALASALADTQSAPPHDSKSGAAPVCDTGTPPAVGKCPACGRGPPRGPSLSSVEAGLAELRRLYLEQKQDGLPAHIANARANTLGKIVTARQQQQALELAERTADLAAENDAAEAEEKGRI